MVKILTKANYLAEGLWKCAKSPTGAHHWVVVSRSMTCRHCAQIRDTGIAKTGVTTSGASTTELPGLD